MHFFRLTKLRSKYIKKSGKTTKEVLPIKWQYFANAMAGQCQRNGKALPT